MPGTESQTPSGWPFGDAILVCLDLECHCRNQTYPEFQRGIRSSQHRVTEIGIAAFDPRRVCFDDAGDRGVKTWPSIKARNFAIIENKHVVKKGQSHPFWCKTGDANDFIFGETRWIRKANTKKTVVQQIQGFLGDRNVEPNAPYRNSREVIFLFFDDQNDMKWLASLGVNLSTEFPNSRTIDIQSVGLASQMASGIGRERVGACVLFSRLRIDTPHAHNGGNDAVYEMRSFIADQRLGGHFPDHHFPKLGVHGDVVEEYAVPAIVPESGDGAWSESSDGAWLESSHVAVPWPGSAESA